MFTCEDSCQNFLHREKADIAVSAACTDRLMFPTKSCFFIFFSPCPTNKGIKNVPNVLLFKTFHGAKNQPLSSEANSKLFSLGCFVKRSLSFDNHMLGRIS